MRDLADVKHDWLTRGAGKKLTDDFTRDGATLRRTAEGRVSAAHTELEQKLPALRLQEQSATAAVITAQAALDAAIAESGRAIQATQTAREDAGQVERQIRKQLATDLDELGVAHQRALESRWIAFKRARRGAGAAA